MTHDTVKPQRWQRLYAIYMACVGTGALVALLFAVNGTLVNGRQDDERAASDKAVDATTTELLRCFDEWSGASFSTSKAVRDASVKVADATEVRDRALMMASRGFASAIDGTVDPVNLRIVLETLGDAGQELRQASRELSKVRVENPVPAPPSSFCLVEP